MKIGDLVEVKTVAEEESSMTQRFGENIGLIVDIIDSISLNNKPVSRYVVFLHDRQREYWFFENEIKLVN